MKRNDSTNKTALTITALGFEVIGAVVGGYYVGTIVDPHLGLGGYGGFLGICAGLFGFVVHILVFAFRLEKEEERKP